jgi:imidazolonepropionase-like amidohydrolase
VTVLRVRGPALPDGEVRDLYAAGDRWTTDPVPGAELIEGWLLPGLVDAHTHPGAENLGDPLDEKIPAQFGQFFDGWGRRADHDTMPGLAAAQAARTGWAKIIADWSFDDEPVPVDVLRRIVEGVHAVGGRVAVHSQRPGGGTAAVQAGVDSIEHGMGLDPGLLPEMAAKGIAFTPTLAVLQSGIARARTREDSPAQRAALNGRLAHPALTAAAAEAGVTLLAGTDTRPMGGIATEVRAMIEAGVPAHAALGAASWSARAYLGLPGLEPGAPADAVIYRADPRTGTDELDHPQAVVLRGVRVR